MKRFIINGISVLFTVLFLISCSKKEIIIDNGEGINIEFIEGLNDDDKYKLSRDSNGFYELTLNRNSNQTIQRITGRLLRNGKPVEDSWSGPRPKEVSFSSNLFWWLMEGDTVANITKTYINYFTGELTYVNLPPLLNWQDLLVPTVNSSGYADDNTGLFNTVIGPIREMVGDTMKITAEYTHHITMKEEGSMFFQLVDEKVVFKDSTYIILK